MKLRLPILALFMFLVVNMAAVSTGPDEFLGHWRGMADGQISFTLDIEMAGDDLAVKLNAAEQGMVDVMSNSSELTDEHAMQISFELPNGLTLFMDGELNDKERFVGTYEMGEQFGTFSASQIKTNE